MKTKKLKKKLLWRASVVAIFVYLSAMMLIAAERRISVAAVGDCIITTRLSPHTEERFLKLIELIRKADVAYANMEGTIHDNKGYPGIGMNVNVMAEPFIADELKWAGFDIMGMANNHSLDYLIEGMFATQKNLDRVGIVHAGTGRNLELASIADYFESKNGRIALINCTSSYQPGALASATRGEMIGRPGINPLRLKTTYQVTKSDLEALTKIGTGLMPRRAGWTPGAKAEIYNFLNIGRFKVGPKREVIVEAEDRDIKRITNAIKRARQNAHLVMVSIHDHRQGLYLKEFAHSCIDAGADAFFGAGPHILTGHEIYKGKPIFYSLGNFIHTGLSMKRVPAEVYELFGDKLDNLRSNPHDFFNLTRDNREGERRWTSVVAWMVFSDGKLEEIKLYPISLNYGTETAGPLGRPFLADEETGKRIIEEMIRLSAPYGTKITYREGIGVVQVK